MDIYLGVSKNRVTPKMDGLYWKTLLKWDDLGGYHYFRKHLYLITFQGTRMGVTPIVYP